jgi:hypothetical protein
VEQSTVRYIQISTVKITKERKRKSDKEIRFLHGQLEEFKWRHSKGRSTEGSRGGEKRMQRKWYEAQHPEVLEIPSEAHATLMYEKSGVSSKAYFYTYKDRARKQHINSMKVCTRVGGRQASGLPSNGTSLVPGGETR